MKKIISLLVVAMTVIAVCSLASCTKNEAKSNTLAGTTWVADATIVQATIKFVDDTKVQYTTTMAGQTVLSMDGTYTYSEPKVTMTMNYMGQTATLVGTISGNSLTLTDQGETVVYTKK